MTDERDDPSKPDEPTEQQPKKPRRRARIRPGYVRVGRPPKKRELISPKLLAQLKEKLGPNPTSLDIMRAARDWYFDRGNMEIASKLAKDVAAFEVPKLSPVDGDKDSSFTSLSPASIRALTDAQLDAWVERIQQSLTRSAIEATTVTPSNSYPLAKRSSHGREGEDWEG